MENFGGELNNLPNGVLTRRPPKPGTRPPARFPLKSALLRHLPV